jgi:hypothetical protein
MMMSMKIFPMMNHLEDLEDILQVNQEDLWKMKEEVLEMIIRLSRPVEGAAGNWLLRINAG